MLAFLQMPPGCVLRHAVFIVPTPVGVNRVRSRVRCPIRDCPHARGGEPSYGSHCAVQLSLSPRPWG